MRRTVTPHPGALLPSVLLAITLGLLAASASPVGAQLGRTCSVFNPCNKGYSCQPGIPQRCYNSPRREGQPCSAGFSCASGLHCTAGFKCEKDKKRGVIHRGMKGRTEPVNAQCVYNQAGYVARVTWYSANALASSKDAQGNWVVRTKSQKALSSRTITLGETECQPMSSGKKVAVISIVNGEVARTAAIVATDIAAVGTTLGCFAGQAAVTVATGGTAAGVAAVACEVVADVAVGIIASPGLIPDAKELAGIAVPPIKSSDDRPELILYGTVFEPKMRVGKP